MIKSTRHSGGDTQSVLAQAYQPIIRGYFAAAAIYYAVMAVADLLTLAGTDRLLLVSAALAAGLAATSAWVWLRRPLRSGQLEAVTSLINLLILGNVMVALQVEYNEAKLVYFVMMAMIFAFASVSMRQALVSIMATLGGLFLAIRGQEPGQLMVYGFVVFAAALSAIAIAYFLRRAIGLAVVARREAESARHYAEGRLAEAETLGETMRQQSLSDSLTGLPNRRAFFQALERNREQNADGSASWLILLDLDGFKAVNDHYGHIIGDELLREVSARLQDYCGPDMHVCRMGGDEFNIIYSGDDTECGIETWCQDLLDRLAATYLIEDRLIQISGSIGCYRVSSGEPDIGLIQKADYALLHAKRTGKNRVVVFREEHAKDAAQRFMIEQALRTAEFGNEIELLFQPQHDLASGEIVCVEALARWHSPVLGETGPCQFIEIAEECGLISKITVAVIDRTLEMIASWGSTVPVSINLSGNDLISDQVIGEIIERVLASGISPSQIEFEVTETAMMADVGRASANLHKLAQLGHSLALDDFGTGYSNFSYLRTLPISKLKVDRSFMQDLGDPMTEKVLLSLVGIARTLNVHCLLEGIENELELLVARRVGAQSVQGFLFGVPMTVADLKKHVDRNRAAGDGGKVSLAAG